MLAALLRGVKHALVNTFCRHRRDYRLETCIRTYKQSNATGEKSRLQTACASRQSQLCSADTGAQRLYSGEASASSSLVFTEGSQHKRSRTQYNVKQTKPSLLRGRLQQAVAVRVPHRAELHVAT
ncbi:hypothetical protein NDU88_006267 [Pleurodeles waltl]|uniref:Uncharacterized protein n=1 Tax=Pleurodeles waltl TaxID=8319 RepID=A0AAV7UL44_PLEWA|nr:hypothetical protein NDU88_006267 [Pleurodeles waltl]